MTRRTSLATLALLAAAVFAAASCGDNLKSHEDDAAVDGPPAVCGNSAVEAGEDCDDGDTTADMVCDDTCHFTCGNGVVDGTFGELCDTGIASGNGACPATCDDGMACTADVLSGSECTAMCVTSPITTPASGDGCCPPGATAVNDDDCPATCGNSIVELGETCDTGIAAGGNGACPTTCSDGMTCTRDMLTGAGSCTAACTFTPITTTMNGDGCCPPGATPLTDTDCVAGCGNGIVDAGETCDTAILVGPGRCPTTCSDGMTCTRDVLSNGGSCTATCTFPPITMAMNGDGCCPAGANATTDTDCMPICGNHILEPPEQCDDGNNIPNDGCNNMCQLPGAMPTAFRMSDLDLRDPHVFVNFLGCRDVTDTALAGFSVNGQLQTSIQTDGTDADALLDLSIAAVFRPLNQAGATNAIEIHFPSCTSPIASTVCSRNPAASPPIPATATNMAAGQCLAALAGTTHGYTPSIVTPSGPCFASNPVTVTINLGGIPITLREARIAATYVGTPAGNLVNGLLLGFISEADADATIIPATFPLVGGQPLSSLLPGGDPPGPNNTNCAPFSDVDINGTTRGWWFYLNFTAPRVTWVDN